MKLFTKLREKVYELYKRGVYSPDVDFPWDEKITPRVASNPHQLKSIPLDERIKLIDAKYNPLIEQACNKG